MEKSLVHSNEQKSAVNFSETQASVQNYFLGINLVFYINLFLISTFSPEFYPWNGK